MAENEDEKQIFSYKKMFKQSDAQIGIIKPAMGGAGYNDKILNGLSKAETGPINVPVLSQRPMLNLLHIPGMKERGVLTRYFYYGYVTMSRHTGLTYPSIKDMKEKVLSGEKFHYAVQTMMQTTRADQSCRDRFLNDSQLEKKLKQKAAATLDEMVATVASVTLKFCGWLMLTLLRHLTSAIHIHQGQMDVLKLVLQEEKPVIYFPLHFSHFDYILLSLITYHNEFRSPFVASGNNLLIQPFSYIMRRVGGFFIRRKIDDDKHRDILYRAVLHSYFTELLKSKQSLEIFIEGTRSRSGLPNLPKTGLLSVAVEALLQDEVEDINLVPICISYEKVLEGTFRNEMMGQAKTPETFLTSVSSICKMLCGFYGHIRVNIGVPQSMKKTLNELINSKACEFSSPMSQPLFSQLQPSLETEKSNDSLSNKRSHMISSVDSAPLLHHSRPGGATDEQIRELVTFLGERIVYSSLTCKVFMSTNLVSFLLLHRWRNGVNLPQLVASFRQLTSELFSRKRDVGFSGDFTDVVLHALDLLGSDLVMLDCTFKMRRSSSSLSVRSRRSADSGYDGAVNELSPEKPASDSGEDFPGFEQEEANTGNYMSVTEMGTFQESPRDIEKLPTSLVTHRAHNKPPGITLYIEPVLIPPKVFDLAYYANALTPVFALESLVALSVGAVLGCRLSTIERKVQNLTIDCTVESVEMSSDDLPEVTFRTFTTSSLVDKTLLLVDVLQIDLVLCDVTTNLREAIIESIDRLTSSGCFNAVEYGNCASTRKSQASKELGFDENDCENETWLRANVEQLPALISMQSVMSSFVEGYVAAATQLTLLQDTPLKEEELREKMLLAAQQRVKHGLAAKSESSSSDIIRNALRSFQWNEVVIRNSNKQYFLGEKYRDTESISDLISRISQFLS